MLLNSVREEKKKKNLLHSQVMNMLNYYSNLVDTFVVHYTAHRTNNLKQVCFYFFDINFCTHVAIQNDAMTWSAMRGLLFLLLCCCCQRQQAVHPERGQVFVVVAITSVRVSLCFLIRCVWFFYCIFLFFILFFCVKYDTFCEFLITFVYFFISNWNWFSS